MTQHTPETSDYTIQQALTWMAQADINFCEEQGNRIEKDSAIHRAVHSLVLQADLIVDSVEACRGLEVPISDVAKLR